MQPGVRSRTRNVVLAAAVSLASYHVLFLVARALNPAGDGYSPWFPPAGAMFAALLLLGWRWVPWMVVVRVSAMLAWSGGTDGVAYLAVQAMAIAVAYGAGAHVLRHLGLPRAHVPEFGRFAIIAVVISPLASAVLVGLADLAFHNLDMAELLEGARTFWVGDALAIAAIVPFVLVVLQTVLFGRPSSPIPMGLFHRAELIAQVALGVLAPLAATSLVADVDDAVVFGLVAVPLLWVALRQDVLETATGIVVIVALCAFGLRERVAGDELLQLQYLLLCSTLLALFSAAVRRTHEDLTAALIDEYNRASLISRSGQVSITEVDLDGHLWRPWSEQLELPREPTALETGLLDRWESFGPATLAGDSDVPIEWDDVMDGEHRSFSSIAMPFDRSDGQLDRIVVVTIDRTERERMRAELRAATERDSVTGLPNRRAFVERLEAGRIQPTEMIGVAVVSFESLRDHSGAPDQESRADTMVAALVSRLRACLPDGIELGCIGETAIGIGAGGDHAARMTELGTAILDELRPAGTNKRALDVPVSVGLEVGRDPIVTLVHDAELAARHASRLGGDRVLRFHPTLRPATGSSLPANEVRRACEAGEFLPYFQPIVDLVSGDVVGAEALARWSHPPRGLLPPAEFIPVAEASGTIARIDELILEQVAEWLRRWERPPGRTRPLSISVNLSPVHLTDPELVANIQSRSAGVDPAQIRFEVTETQAMTNPEAAAEVLRELDRAGFSVILDDFGTGYSSMAWLHQLPVTVMKIDGRFVADLPQGHDSLRIVQLVVSLADDLGIAVTAEGIENADQADLLCELGCSYGQGFYFGRPMSGDAFTAHVATASATPVRR